MSEISAIIYYLRQTYIRHVRSRFSFDHELFKYPDTEEKIRSYMDDSLMRELSKLIRRTTSEDPRVPATIFESDLFVITDPSGFFQRLGEELEGAYRNGFSDGEKRHTN